MVCKFVCFNHYSAHGEDSLGLLPEICMGFKTIMLYYQWFSSLNNFHIHKIYRADTPFEGSTLTPRQWHSVFAQQILQAMPRPCPALFAGFIYFGTCAVFLGWKFNHPWTINVGQLWCRNFPCHFSTNDKKIHITMRQEIRYTLPKQTDK